MGAYRNVALTELPIRGISMNSTGGSAAITVVPSDSGVMFITKYVSADTVYTLPAVADSAGKMFWFFNAQNTKNVNVNAPVNTIFVANDLAASYVVSGVEVGSSCFVICDGTSYYMFEIYGTWTPS